MTVYETTNQNTIYHWVSSRGLWPACVVGSPDRIRIGGDDSANPGEDLEPIEWWRWFQEFDRRKIMLWVNGGRLLILFLLTLAIMMGYASLPMLYIAALLLGIGHAYA